MMAAMEATGRRSLVIAGAATLIVIGVTTGTFLATRTKDTAPVSTGPPTIAPREVIVAKAPRDRDNGPAPPVSVVVYGDGMVVRQTSTGGYETATLPVPTKDGLLARAAQALPYSLDTGAPTLTSLPTADPLLYTQAGGRLRSAQIGPPGTPVAQLDEVLQQVTGSITFIPWNPDRLLLRALGPVPDMVPTAPDPNAIDVSPKPKSWPPDADPQPADIGVCRAVEGEAAVAAAVATLGAPSTSGRWTDARGTWEVVSRPDLLRTGCG